MKKYRDKAEKQIRVDAEQWLEVTYDRKAGINTHPIYHLDVGHFRDPDKSGLSFCKACNSVFHVHGWLEREGIAVCPGNYILTGKGGEKDVLTEECFLEHFEEFDDSDEKASRVMPDRIVAGYWEDGSPTTWNYITETEAHDPGDVEYIRLDRVEEAMGLTRERVDLIEKTLVDVLENDLNVIRRIGWLDDHRDLKQ